MREDYFTIRVPRLDGRKTLAFNLAVLAFAAYAATCAALGALWWQPLSLEASAVLAVVALVNVALRFVTDRPVLWREPRRIVEEWRNTYPEVPEAYEQAAADAQRHGIGVTHMSYDELLRPVPRRAVHAVKGESIADQFESQRNLHAERNEENARVITDHLRASELPDDFDADVVPMNGHGHTAESAERVLRASQDRKKGDG